MYDYNLVLWVDSYTTYRGSAGLLNTYIIQINAEYYKAVHNFPSTNHKLHMFDNITK
jgi:hypothetical protein